MSAEYWWGMPSFQQGDTRPEKRITVNFETIDDYREFCELVGLKATERTPSTWFPVREKTPPNFYEFIGPKVDTRYPVCIPSKGRWDVQTTGHRLDEMGISYRFFVEETEAEQYVAALGESRVVVMPFHDLGRGSIPARNFIWEWAKERGHKRHWILDDNLGTFARLTNNRRAHCRSGAIFRAMEDFVDRYENVALAGPHDRGFVDEKTPNVTPVLWNSRVYSCILADTSLMERWRGRYNEDTDLSLRVLKSGKCTALFRAFLMRKATTTSGARGKPMKGGNTDNVYNTGDHRKAFAESLREQHPDVTEVVWRFNRWHHHVDYRPFAGNTPQLRAGVTPTLPPNEYGLRLTRNGEPDDAA